MTICPIHKLVIEKVCLRKGCKDNQLCAKCLLIHSGEHASDFTDQNRVFNESGDIILMKYANENLKQKLTKGISALKEQQTNLIDEVEKLSETLQRQLADHLESKLTDYRKEIKKFFHAQQNILFSHQKPLQASTHAALPVDQLQSELLKYQKFQETTAKTCLDSLDLITHKASAKQNNFINKSNYSACMDKLKTTVDSCPLLILKQVDEIPFEQQKVESLSIVHQFTSHSDWINKIAYLQTNQVFASASSDSTIRVFDMKSSREVCQLEGHIDGVNSIVSWDENRLISGGMDKTIRIWDWQSSTCEASLYGHEKSIRAIIKLSDEFFASGGGEKCVFVWSYSNKKLAKQLPECDDTILCLAKLHGDFLAAGSAKGLITIYDYMRNSNQTIRQIACHSAPVKTLLYMKDELTLISGGDDNIIAISTYKNDRNTSTKLTAHKGSVTSLVHLNQPNLFISSSWDGRIILWDSQQGVPLLEVEEKDNFITSACYLNDGKTIVSGGSDHILRIWAIKISSNLEDDIHSNNGEVLHTKEDQAISLPQTRNQCEMCVIF